MAHGKKAIPWGRAIPGALLLAAACLRSAAGRAGGEEPAAALAPVGAAPASSEAERPRFLDRPLEGRPAEAVPAPAHEDGLLQNPVLPPLGFTGPSGICPRETQQTSDFVPMEDRWRAGFPAWDRYGLGHPCGEDYPYEQGHWWDPYNQNVLKGDYPIVGQHTFLNVTASSLTLFDGRQVPTGTTPFESTARPNEQEFFGRPNQREFEQYFSLSLDLFHGDAGFKPVDWRIKLTPVFNINYVSVDELAVVNPDVRKGTDRGRTFFSLQEYFIETKIADLSPDYDFLSVRIGSQPFVSDFRGFIFSDTNRAIRLFGTRLSERDQFNLIYFNQAEKDTNSELNTFSNRHQDIFIANYYHQDFIWPGYTTELSIIYNHDIPSFHFDKDDFLVRPDPTGVFQPHQIDVVYLGWAGDGHINWLNVSNAFYWALGHDSMNPLAGAPQDINAQFAAVELSVDQDWARFRTSFLWSSGDRNINNSHATGFDSVFDNPNFAGGDFSFWQRQQIQLLGVNLVQKNSLIPDLRSSKIEGQSNFVNPGLVLLNFGVDFELTPKLRMINNVNFLWFDETAVLKQFVFQDKIRSFIGTDLSTGFEYRPLLNNNVITRFGLSMLVAGDGFRDLYGRLDHVAQNPLMAGFVELRLTF